jgi:hypothetical protein
MNLVINKKEEKELINIIYAIADYIEPFDENNDFNLNENDIDNDENDNDVNLDDDERYILDEEALTDLNVNALGKYLFYDYEERPDKDNKIIIIIYYCYILAKIEDNNKLNQINFVNLMENNSIENIISELDNDPDLRNIVFNSYFQANTDEDIMDKIEDNEAIITNLKYNEYFRNDEMYDVSTIVRNFLVDNFNLLRICKLDNDETIVEISDWITRDILESPILPFYFDSKEKINEFNKYLDQELFTKCYIYLKIKEQKIGLYYDEEDDINDIYILMTQKKKNYRIDYYKLYYNLLKIYFAYYKNYYLLSNKNENEEKEIEKEVLKRIRKKEISSSYIMFI